jgi:hypothetical protein
LAVDHIWIRVTPGAPEAQVLRDAGFQFQEFPVPGSASPSATVNYAYTHTGQGTANNIVRFNNVYLELIWVDDSAALETVAPELGYTLLHPTDSSPLGLGLRHAGMEVDEAPFPTVPYRADWMQSGTEIAVAVRGESSDPDPAIFIVPRYMRWDTRVESNPEMLASATHQIGVGDVTRIRVFGPGQPSGSAPVEALERQGLVEFLGADEHLVEIEFDDSRSEQIDFRPDLPLRIFF